MRAKVRAAAASVFLGVGVLAAAVAPAGAMDGPTCSDMMGIAVHGQHVVGDYVTGIGNQALGWPPQGQVGDATGGRGAAVPGGPGPRFHWANGNTIPPGASFCVGGAQSINGAENQQASNHVPDVR